MANRPWFLDVRDLNEHEINLLRTMLDRLREGRKEHGPWELFDGRDMVKEALEEQVDGALYSATALLRLMARKEAVAEAECSCGNEESDCDCPLYVIEVVEDPFEKTIVCNCTGCKSKGESK